MNDFLTQAIAMKALKNGGSGGAAGGNAEQIAKNKADIILLKEGITDLKSVMKDIHNNTPHASTIKDFYNIRRTGKVYQTKIWKFATNPTSSGEKLLDNAGLEFVPSTDTTEGKDDYLNGNHPLFDWVHCNYKDSWMVYTTIAKRKDDGHFIDIMGVRIYRQHITIRRRVFLRVRRSYKKAQSLVKQRKKIPIWLARKCMSYKGILDHTDSYNIKRRYNANKTIQICKGVISHESKIRHYARECYC